MDEAKTVPQSTLSSPVTRKKQPQQTLTSPYLPFDLVEEILCRLPVKHLIQFCCVCKLWNSLISADSNFSNRHLRLSTSKPDRHHLMMRSMGDSPESFLGHSSISSIFGTASPTQFMYPLEEILNKVSPTQYMYPLKEIEASACDGILCIRIQLKYDYLVLLYNPSIRKLKILPPLIFPQQRYVKISYTLVYDRFTNNYKIIAVKSSRKIEVRIHNLGTDYWRRIPDFSDCLFIFKLGIFVNDSVNWLVRDVAGGSRFIVALDLEKESYQKLSLPAFVVQFTTSSISLGILKDCLSLLSHRDKFFDVWIMKEYGNEKSWTKLLSVPHMKEFGVCYSLKALYISKDDQLLMEFHRIGKYSLVVYDSINNTFKIPEFQNMIIARAVYVESLISPL